MPYIGPQRYSLVVWLDASDLEPMGDPEVGDETLNTRTLGLLIPSPFGKDTDVIMELYADRQTTEIVTTVREIQPSDQIKKPAPKPKPMVGKKNPFLED